MSPLILAVNRMPKNLLAQYHAPHVTLEIMDSNLEDRSQTAYCNHRFSPITLQKVLISERYTKMLLDATANLNGEARAKALGQGLEETHFFNDGTVRRLVFELVPELVGRKAAPDYLPERYAAWLQR
jgi:hypothetical protein